MKIFEPHIHMSSRTTDDYEALAAAGVTALVEPAFWMGQPRTAVGSFVDYFNSLVGWERYRSSLYGISHHCTIALNPKEANDDRFRSEVMALLPRYLEKDRVVAVGETGYDSTTPAEDEVLRAHLQLALEHELPALVHTPHRNKLEGTKRTLEVVEQSGLSFGHVLIDHNNEITVPELVNTGVWMGFSIYPKTKMSEERMVRVLQQYGTDRMIINSAADWGTSDPLKIPKTIAAMRDAGFSEEEITKVVWDNPVEFYGQSGRLELFDEQPAGSSFEGNSVRRGEAL